MNVMFRIIFSFLITIGVSTVSADNNFNQKNKVMTSGLSHLGLSVSNLNASSSFFVDTLGWKLVGEKPNYPAKFVTDGHIVLTLWQIADDQKLVPFNRKANVGLHHLALSVASFEILNELHQRLILAEGIVIEFSPELNGKGPTKHMMIREPSGNRIEFTHKPNAE
jgi:lactoylglutathione lyase